MRDGEGLVGRGRLVRSGKSWDVEMIASQHAAQGPALTLAIGAGDRDRFAWVVEKATELGVTAVVPLECERSAAVASKLRPQHLERLRRHGLEAVKQSGAAWATRVEEPLSLEALVARPLAGKGWVADAGGSPVPAAPRRHPAHHRGRARRRADERRAGTPARSRLPSGRPGSAHAPVRDGRDRGRGRRGGGTTSGERWLSACSARSSRARSRRRS